MKCDSCMHNLACKHREEMREFEEKLRELEKSMNLKPNCSNVNCENFWKRSLP